MEGSRQRMRSWTQNQETDDKEMKMGFIDEEICFCNKRAKLKTALTDLNPSRRFWACQSYQEKGGCGYFAWFDPEMCRRLVTVIPGLLRKINTLEVEKAASNKRMKILKNGVVFLCIIVVILLLMMKN